MKVLITGARGQLGTALARVSPIDVEPVYLGRDELDITDEGSVAQALADVRPDALINCAAYTNVDHAQQQSDLAWRINAKAVCAIAAQCRSGNIHLTHVSTDYVFDGRAEEPYRVDAIRNPLSVYGLSKARGEDAIGGNAALIRTSWLYDMEGRNFVTAVLQRARVEESLRVVDDEYGCPTHVDGLAEILWSIAKRRSVGRFHYCDAGTVSRFEFAVAIGEIAQRMGVLKRRPKVEAISSGALALSATRPKRAVLDTASTQEQLGRRTMPWRENLERAFSQMNTHA